MTMPTLCEICNKERCDRRGEGSHKFVTCDERTVCHGHQPAVGEGKCGDCKQPKCSSWGHSHAQSACDGDDKFYCHGFCPAQQPEGWETTLTSYRCCLGKIELGHKENAEPHYIITEQDIELVRTELALTRDKTIEEIEKNAPKKKPGEEQGWGSEEGFDSGWNCAIDEFLAALRSMKGGKK